MITSWVKIFKDVVSSRICICLQNNEKIYRQKWKRRLTRKDVGIFISKNILLQMSVLKMRCKGLESQSPKGRMYMANSQMNKNSFPFVYREMKITWYTQ